MEAFPVRMPSGTCYWTVVDEGLRPVPVADAYLRHVRFGRDDAESTTKSYAGSVALYLAWCELTRRDWTTAAGELGSFILWLRHSPSRGGSAAHVVVPGPGAPPVRGPRRVNAVLAATRGFLCFAVDQGEAPAQVLHQLYELADSHSLPAEARGEDGAWRLRMRARHRVQEPASRPRRASDEAALKLVIATECDHQRLPRGDPVHAVNILTLFLAFSVALNIGCAAGIAHRYAGSSSAQAFLTAAGTVATVMALFFAAVAAYH